jgi:predicted nucleic acid-binding protein
VKVYLDMCALKRPFDDQSQARIFVESTAVARILEAAGAGRVRLLNSVVLVYENGRNPNVRRREGVAALLEWIGPATPASAPVFQRAGELVRKGIPDLDALHVSFAEHLGADSLVTVDDRLLARADELSLEVAVTDPVSFLRRMGP